MLRHRIVAGVAALAMMAGFSTAARADVAYAYSQQQITGLIVSSVTASGSIQTGSNSGASFATGASATDPTDAPQSYLGPNPVPAENLFTHVATFPGADPQPAGTAPIGMSTGASLQNFTRGDVAYASSALFTSGVSVNNVAESYLNTGTGTASGTGGWTLTASFTVSASTSIVINYNYANSLYTYTSNNTGSAQANYHFDVTVKDQSGNSVFVADPSAVNHSFGSPPNNSSMLNTTGSGSVTTGILTAGQLYTIVVSGNENTFVRLAVPEPGPLVLAGVAGGLALAAGLKRKLARKPLV